MMLRPPAPVLAAALVLASLPLRAVDAPAELEPVVITATRSPQPANRLPAALVVITRQDIERSGATHLIEVLRARAGVEVIDAFGDGSRSTVGLRGFGENAHSNTLVLVNGRRLNNADIGAPDFNSIALQDVERIEIVQGSVGALLGDQAVGGVINIITRAPQDGASLDAGYGSYDRRSLRGSGSRAWGSGGARLSALASRTDNYREHNALDYWNVLGRIEQRAGDGEAWFEAQSVSEYLETPGALLEPEVRADRRQAPADFRKDYFDTLTHSASAGITLPFGDWNFDAEASARATDGRSLQSFRGSPQTEPSHQDRRVLALAPRLSRRLALPAGAALLTAGADFARTQYRFSSTFGPQSDDQDLREGFVQALLPVAAGLELTLAARHGSVTNELRDTVVFPAGGTVDDSASAWAAGLAWTPAAGLRLFARHDGNYRFPKADEYYNSRFTPGPTPLRTQTGRSLEAGADWKAGGARGTVLAYRLDIEDELAFDPSAFLNANFDRTRRDGVLVEAATDLTPTLEVKLSLAYVDARFTQGATTGNDVPLVADRIARVGVSWAAIPQLRAGLELQGTGSRALGGDTDADQPRLPGYAVLNSSLRYERGRWRAGARLNNLLDTEYSELGVESFFGPAYYPSPGFNASVEIGASF